MREERKTSLDEAKRLWQEEAASRRRLTRAWLHAAIPHALEAECERHPLQLAFGLALSTVISAVMFLYGGALYKAHWQSQLDSIALLKSFATVVPFESEQ